MSNNQDYNKVSVLVIGAGPAGHPNNAQRSAYLSQAYISTSKIPAESVFSLYSVELTVFATEKIKIALVKKSYVKTNPQ